MAYVLYFVLLIGFCILIPRIRFLKTSGIPVRWLITLFLIRAMAGVVNCYLSYHFFEISDPLAFHNIALNEYHLLITDPAYFVSETFRDYARDYGGFFDTSHSFWNNLKNNVIVKTLAILDLFTFRNFYINTLVFNILVFFGCVALFRSIRESVTGNKILLIAALFLMPSALFYSSAIHRDGLVLLCIGFIAFSFGRICRHGPTWKRVAMVALPLLLVFALRNYLVFILLPALLAWWLSNKAPSRTAAIFALITFFCILAFFVLKRFIPAADFPRFVVNRLSDFDEIAVVSRTYLPVVGLTPDFIGFLKALPIALYHSLVLPAVWNIGVAGEWPFAIELAMIQILFLYWLFSKKAGTSKPLVYFLTFVCIASFVMIGYTVPNLGAIIRYRSIYLLIITCLLVYRLPIKRPIGFN